MLSSILEHSYKTQRPFYKRARKNSKNDMVQVKIQNTALNEHVQWLVQYNLLGILR